MKKISVLAGFFCLFLAAGAVFAQNKTANFAGSWQLDAAKSKLPERMRVESITMNVTQTDKELSVETITKRAARPEGEMPNSGNGGMPIGGNRGMRRGGNGGGGMMGGGNGTVTYILDGKETTIKTEAPGGGMSAATITRRAAIEKDGKLNLSSSRTVSNQTGEFTAATKEVWELTDGGKTLKVTRDTESPRGTQSSEMYFTKDASFSAASGKDMAEGYQGKMATAPDSSFSGANPMSKSVAAGVLNGKALKLVQPDYPPAARAVRASGAVNVQVTFDEQGNVVSASAVSGHPLLRAAAEKAARQAEFAPVLLDGVPVKVTGVIVYNFVP